MATILLIVIYADFIGLGIPDSVFGAAWPEIYSEFGVPMSYASFVSLTVAAGTALFSVMSVWLINKLGTARICAISTCLTAGALLGFSFSHNVAFMCLMALPLGLGGGAIDAALNNYVALHYRASHMNFLHCFYGIGVSVSPYLVSLAMKAGGGWRGGYRLVALVQALIAVITVVSLPLWKKARDAAGDPEDKFRLLSVPKLLKVRGLWLVWLVFIGSCAAEHTCGIWGSTFLVNCRGLTPADAAGAVAFYYIGIAAGRFISGVIAARLSSWKIVFAGQGLTLAAFALLLIPDPAFAVAGLFLFGLGNGPLFPNMIHLTPSNFGRDISQIAVSSQMAAAYVGVLSAPPLCGLLMQNVDPAVFPFYLLCCILVMIVFAAAAHRVIGKSKNT